MKILEKDILKAAVQFLQLKRIFVWRNNSGAFKRDNHFYKFGYAGSPDLICHLNKKIIYLEIKTPKGKMSPSQIEFQKQCQADGIDYFIVRNVEDLKSVLKTYGR